MRRVFVALALLLAAAPTAVAGVNTWTGSGPPGGISWITPEAGTNVVYGYANGKLVTLVGNRWVFRSQTPFGSGALLQTIDGYPGTILALGEDGNGFSKDGGRTFGEMFAPQMASSGRPGGTVFVGGFDGLRTTHDFVHFRTLNRIPLSSIGVSPSDPDTVFVGRDTGIFVSHDAGRTFRLALAVPGVDGGAFIGQFAFTGPRSQIIYATANGGLERSLNGGRTWTLLTSITDVFRVSIDPFRPATIFAQTIDGLLRTTNAGATWTKVDLAGQSGIVAFDPDVPGLAYSGSRLGGLRSTDHGATWTTVVAGLTDSEVVALAASPTAPGRLYAATGGTSFWSSAAPGSPWVTGDVGLGPNDGIQQLMFTKGSTPALIARGLFASRRSTDGGVTWSDISGLPEFTVYGLSAGPAGEVWAGTFDDVIRRSTDGGATFAPVPGVGLPVTSTYFVAADPVQPGTAFAITFEGLFRTTDGGETFGPVAIDPIHVEGPVDNTWMVFDPVDPNIAYLTAQRADETFEDVVFRSTDAGLTWTVLPARPSPDFVTSMTVDTAGTLWIATNTGQIASLPRGSDSWTDRTANMFRNYIRVLVADAAPGVVHAGTSTDGVLTLGR